MRVYLLFLILIILTSVASAQYVAGTLQQRIDNDNNSINLDLQDIVVKNADIQSIVNDTSANQVTSQVADVQAIEANAIAVNIVAQPITP